MQLDIKQRLLLSQILPTTGNVITLRLLEDIRKALSFPEEEIQALKLTFGPTGTRWDEDAETAKPKAIAIGKTAFNVICNELKRLNDIGQLHFEMIPLYDMFVEGKAEPDPVPE